MNDMNTEAVMICGALGLAAIDTFLIFTLIPKMIDYAGQTIVTLAGEIGEIGPEQLSIESGGGAGGAALAGAALAA